MRGIKASVRDYEDWLRQAIGSDFVEDDLEEKHRKMRKGPSFTFLRATYWRFAETVFELKLECAAAPPVLAIGDTHLENFGTWRDAEGRLVWGANDFDEAAVMPYAFDLVRLAASALLARKDGDLSAGDIAAAILAGYTAGIADPQPLLLERDHRWLRETVLLPETERAAFWDKVEALPEADIPKRYRKALTAALHRGTKKLAFAPRQAGTGSLGRPRFLARGRWKSGPLLREAKAVVASAWSLSHAPGDMTIRAGEIATGRFRAADPHYTVKDGIVVRRLSPNSRKIEAKDSGGVLLAPVMLRFMGREIANCHAADKDARAAIKADLEKREKTDWLRDDARTVAAAVERDRADYAS